MEGERILRELLKKKLDGLYDDTKNYIATLTRVLEPDVKNGYNCRASGCNTVEAIVSKYSGFCNKFLRCGIEILKGAKYGGDLEEMMQMINMVMNVLDLVLMYDNGKYLKHAPSLDDVGTKLYHITSQLVNKGEFDMSLDYINYCIKYLQLAKNTKGSVDKELKNVAKTMGTLSWKAALLLEQSSKESGHLVSLNALKLRMCSVTLDAEASSGALESLVPKAVRSMTKFQMDCQSIGKDFDFDVTVCFESLFCILVEQVSRQYNCSQVTGVEYVFIIFELSLPFVRLLQNFNKIEEANVILEKLQSLTSEIWKPMKTNTLESCFISRFSSCNILLTKATVLMGKLSKNNAAKPCNFEQLDKLLDKGYESLELALQSKQATKQSTISQTLEYLKRTLQKLAIPLPNRTFQYVQLVLEKYGELLQSEMQSLLGKKPMDVQLKQQQQKSVSRYLSLSGLVIERYRHHIQRDNTSVKSDQLSKCLQYSQQCSAVITTLISTHEVCSPDELIWHSSLTFSMGNEFYKQDAFELGADFMSVGCSVMKQWCFTCCHDSDISTSTLHKSQLLHIVKFEVLHDSQRRTKRYKEAYDTATTIMELFLHANQVVDLSSTQADFHKYLELWLRAKHDVITHSCQDDLLSEMASRTLLDIVEDNRATLHITTEQLGYLLHNELDWCKTLSERYDTSLEQFSITRQLIDLYRKEQDTFSLASALLEHVKSLHLLGLTEDNDRTLLDICQEAVGLLDALLNDSQATDPLVITVQDMLASAYMWLGILQHEETMKQHEIVSNKVNCEEDEKEQKESHQIIDVEQPFVQSLKAAIGLWTTMVEQCLNHSNDGKIDLSRIPNPVDTSNSIKTVGLLYGLLNQPLSQVHANNLCAIINQAIDTPDALNNTILVYSQSIRTLCNIHDLYHAQLLMSYSTKIEQATSLESAVYMQLLLAKSHLYLELGQFSDGEKCLSAALESEFLTGKNCGQVVLKSVAHSLLAKYLQIPPTIYQYQLPKGLDDKTTPLDATIESISNLESLASKLFSCKNSEDTTNESFSTLYSPNISSNKNPLFVMYNLLMCQIQCGSMLTHQGMVKQAITYLTDGLSLAKKIVLPYRVAEFVNSLSLVALHKGDLSIAKDHLLYVAQVLEPVLQTSGDKTVLERCLQVPPLVSHQDACRCVGCTDPVLQSIQIEFFLTMSKYLESLEQYGPSIAALEVADELISHATQKIPLVLDECTKTLQLGVANPDQELPDNKSNKGGEGRKKGNRKTKTKQPTKAVKQGGDVNPSLSSSIQMMYSFYLVQVFVQNAVILLGNNKSIKALEVIGGGMDVVQYIEKVTGSTPPWIVPSTVHLLYLKGVIYLLQGLDHDNSALDSVWGVPNGVQGKVQSSDCIQEKKRTNRTRSGKSTVCVPPHSDVLPPHSDVEKVVKRKGRGRSKKADAATDPVESERECSHGKRKGEKENNISQGLQPAIDTFTKALDLCSCWPHPKLFSQLCQSLALCYGQSQASKTAHYLDLSLGVTLRHEATYSTRKKIRKLSKDIKSQVSCDDMTSLTNKISSVTIQDIAGDCETMIKTLQQTRQLMLFQSHLADHDMNTIPKDWTICTLIPVKIPGKPQQLIISRQRPGRNPVVVKVPMPDSDHCDDNDTTSKEKENKIVMELSQLFECSIQQEFADIMQSSFESMSISSSKKWNHVRSRLDAKLKNLLEKMENSWLGMWKGIILGQTNDSHQHEAVEQATKVLAAKLGKHIQKTVDVDLLEILVDSNDYLTAQQTTKALSIITGMDYRSSGLDKILQEFQQCISSLATRPSTKKKSPMSNDRHPVILILGKEIQHLPWESIPILREYPVTRMPSMHLVLAQAQKADGDREVCVVDPKKTYYVLNPEDNLPNTQKIFQNWFESELKWRGVTGQKPSQDQYKSALVDHELFLYLGHGTGQTFLRGDDIQRTICRATTMLMGCSSAKLTVGGICEPRGMSLNYLLAGCPAILGNLWDVTDRDIDRFTKSLLQAWLQTNQKWSLPQFIRNARQACKWPYLIGASPVLYGIPVFLKN